MTRFIMAKNTQLKCIVTKKIVFWLIDNSGIKLLLNFILRLSLLNASSQKFITTKIQSWLFLS